MENGLTPQMKELIEGQYDMLLVFDEKIDKLDIQIEAISKKFVNDCKKLKALDQLQL
jgi:chromatin segregation and condensation protein Rec8/ScpA/Scc1 (kleisin family)